MAERILHGRPAAPGLAAGPLAVLAASRAATRAAGTPSQEAAALRAALERAVAEIGALVETAEGEAADMLAFQSAMLEDDELARPAFEAIGAGQSAPAAWEAAMDSEIDNYRASDDSYFAARTADLEDMRDRVLNHLVPAASGASLPQGAVVVAADLPLSRFLAIDWTQGGAIVLTQGSPSSHVAMLARARGVPMVVGLGTAPGAEGEEALVDAAAGEIVIAPSEATRSDFARRRAEAQAASATLDTWRLRPAITADGARIRVHLNIADPSELDTLDPATCDGIGLVRTELLFHDSAGLPDEAAQEAIYRRIALWAQGRPVTIRTLDAGGDKPIPGVTMDGESNPFLGLRGIRLSLRHPEMFATQLRALARAALHGDVRIMLPMVTIPDELARANALLDEAIDALAREGLPARRPPLGMMVEVPAAAIAVDRFDADFFSIGSNDLTQYVTAAGRDIDTVADLADPLNPAVLRLIETVARHGARSGREVSLCGDAGGDARTIGALLHAGLRSVSVAPSALARTKQAIAGIDLRVP